MDRNKAIIFQIPINSGSYTQLLREIVTYAREPNQSRLVFTPNPEFILKTRQDADFKNILQSADINLPDGIGLIFWSRILGWRLRQRVAGADVVGDLLDISNQRSWTVGIVGSRWGMADEQGKLVNRLKKMYPRVRFIQLDNIRINIKFNIIFACQGMVKQEEWIWQNKEKYQAGVLMGVGGSLDFVTGFSKRAPKWVRKVGLEWFWRIIQRPSHLRRAFRAVVVFSWLVITNGNRKK